MRIAGDCVVLASLIEFLIFTIAAAEPCPPGWTWNKGKFRCMKVINIDAMDYGDAIDGCESIGAELISIEDSTDQADVDCLISKESSVWGYWIDIKDNGVKWQFGNGDEVTWFNWYDGQPDDRNSQDCVAIEQSSLKWHDQNCISNPKILQYICTKKSGNATLVETNFKKEPSRCLSKHSVMQRYPTGDNVASMECVSSCSADKCCSAAAVSADECLHYIANRTADSQECVDQLYEMFTKN